MTRPAPSADLRPIDRLLAIMARLRDREDGCPWDQEQTFETIAPYTVEEAYEVADAIERGDLKDLRDELGDLLLQVVFHARMAEEQGAFGFEDVARAINDKMVRRHPHVFADDPDAHRLAKLRASCEGVDVVHLIYRTNPKEGQAKDYEFSRQSMREHWASGHADALRTLSDPRWLSRDRSSHGVRAFDLNEGLESVTAVFPHEDVA